MMLTVNHFKRPFINAVLESINEVDESFNKDFNDCQNLNTMIYTI